MRQLLELIVRVLRGPQSEQEWNDWFLKMMYIMWGIIIVSAIILAAHQIYLWICEDWL